MDSLVSEEVTVNSCTFQWILISRRNIKRGRNGLFMRGCDSEGNPANYVETEQIVEYPSSANNSGGRCSFVQVRDLFPSFGLNCQLEVQTPPVTVKYANQRETCRRHLIELTNTYGAVVFD